MIEKREKSTKMRSAVGQYNGQAKIFRTDRKVFYNLTMEDDNGENFSATIVEQFRWIDEENKELIMFDVFDSITTLQIGEDDQTPVQLGIRAEDLPPVIENNFLH